MNERNDAAASTAASSNSKKCNMIRHSGRAQIRGRIRRVWRPRFLELCDSGIVRYYEIPMEADNNSTSAVVENMTISLEQKQQNLNSNGKHHLKCTLLIYSARIVDPTTFRDLHVGLPKGTYGFIFHAQRQLPIQASSTFPSSMTDVQTLLPFGGAELQQCHPPEHFQPRDFLCAVSTLEDAQTWVVALQWAATMHAARHSSPLTSNRGGMLPTISGSWDYGDDDDDYYQQSQNHSNSAFQVVNQPASPLPSGNNADLSRSPKPSATSSKTNSSLYDNTTLASSDTTTTATISKKKLPPRRKDKAKGRQSGKIVVTNVKRYKFVRIIKQQNISIDIAYEIRLLLIRTSSNRARTTVDERIMSRTLNDICILLEELEAELAIGKIASTAPRQVVSKAKKALLKVGTILNTSYLNVVGSISIINNIIRTFALDPVICNSKAMRIFWCLIDNDGSKNNAIPKQSLHDMVGQKIANAFFSDLPPIHQPNNNYVCKKSFELQTSIDEYVKSWLQQPDEEVSIHETTAMSTISSRGAGLFVADGLLNNNQHPLITIVICTVWASLFIIFTTHYERLITHHAIRSDVLILSWFASLLAGREWSRNSSNSRISVVMHQEQRQKKMQKGSPKAKIEALRNKSRNVALAPPKNEQQENDNLGRSRAGSASSFVELQSIVSGASDGNEYVMDEVNHTASSTCSPLAAISDEGNANDNISDKFINDVRLSPSIMSESTTDEDEGDVISVDADNRKRKSLPSPLPQYPENDGLSCWSKPESNIFKVRGSTYLQDRIKISSSKECFNCLGVDLWLTDNPERHIARHPSVLGGKLKSYQADNKDVFLVNFLLPFGNFIVYFEVCKKFPTPQSAKVWKQFINGDQEFRDKRLKMLPVVVDGPWIVRKAVGSGTSPALLGKVIPLQYYFNAGSVSLPPSAPTDGPVNENSEEEKRKSKTGRETDKKGGTYEVDVIITASRIAKGILSVVKGHTNMLTIAFAFIIEGTDEAELPETALCTVQMHSINLEDCPQLPECNLDDEDYP